MKTICICSGVLLSLRNRNVQLHHHRKAQAQSTQNLLLLRYNPAPMRSNGSIASPATSSRFPHSQTITAAFRPITVQAKLYDFWAFIPLARMPAAVHLDSAFFTPMDYRFLRYPVYLSQLRVRLSAYLRKSIRHRCNTHNQPSSIISCATSTSVRNLSLQASKKLVLHSSCNIALPSFSCFWTDGQFAPLELTGIPRWRTVPGSRFDAPYVRQYTMHPIAAHGASK